MAKAAPDLLDRRILEILQQNCALTMAELAERTGSTPATCHRRVAALRRLGLISREVAVASRKHSLEPVTVIIGFSIRGQNKDRQHLVRTFLRAQPPIRMVWMTTGEFDYIAVAAFSDVQALHEFIDGTVAENDLFAAYRTYVAIDEVKMDFSSRFI